MKNNTTPLSQLKDAVHKALQSYAHQSQSSVPIVMDPGTILHAVSWIRFGTINLSTGKSVNVQEIHFDSPSEKD